MDCVGVASPTRIALAEGVTGAPSKRYDGGALATSTRSRKERTHKSHTHQSRVRKAVARNTTVSDGAHKVLKACTMSEKEIIHKHSVDHLFAINDGIVMGDSKRPHAVACSFQTLAKRLTWTATRHLRTFPAEAPPTVDDAPRCFNFMDTTGRSVDFLPMLDMPLECMLASVGAVAQTGDAHVDRVNLMRSVHRIAITMRERHDFHARTGVHASELANPSMKDIFNLFLQRKVHMTLGSPLRDHSTVTDPEVRGMMDAVVTPKTRDGLRELYRLMPSLEEDAMFNPLAEAAHVEPRVVDILFAVPMIVLENPPPIKMSPIIAQLLIAARQSYADHMVWVSSAKRTAQDAARVAASAARDESKLDVEDEAKRLACDTSLCEILGHVSRSEHMAVHWLPLCLQFQEMVDTLEVSVKISQAEPHTHSTPMTKRLHRRTKRDIHHFNCSTKNCMTCRALLARRREEEVAAKETVDDAKEVYTVMLSLCAGEAGEEEWLEFVDKKTADLDDTSSSHHQLVVNITSGQLVRFTETTVTHTGEKRLLTVPAFQPMMADEAHVSYFLDSSDRSEVSYNIDLRFGTHLRCNIGTAYQMACNMISAASDETITPLLQSPKRDVPIDPAARQAWLAMNTDPCLFYTTSVEKITRDMSSFHEHHLNQFQASLEVMHTAEADMVIRGFSVEEVPPVTFTTRDSAALLSLCRSGLKELKALREEKTDCLMLDGHALPLLFNKADGGMYLGLAKVDVLKDCPNFGVFHLSQFGGVVCLGLLCRKAWERWDGVDLISLTKCVKSPADFLMLSLEISIENQGAITSRRRIWGHGILRQLDQAMSPVEAAWTIHQNTLPSLAVTSPTLFIAASARIIDAVADEFGWISTLAALMVVLGCPVMKHAYFLNDASLNTLAHIATIDFPTNSKHATMELLLTNLITARATTDVLEMVFDSGVEGCPTRAALKPLVELIGTGGGCVVSDRGHWGLDSTPIPRLSRAQFTQWQLESASVTAGFNMVDTERKACTINHNLRGMNRPLCVNCADKDLQRLRTLCESIPDVREIQVEEMMKGVRRDPDLCEFSVREPSIFPSVFVMEAACRSLHHQPICDPSILSLTPLMCLNDFRDFVMHWRHKRFESALRNTSNISLTMQLMWSSSRAWADDGVTIKALKGRLARISTMVRNIEELHLQQLTSGTTKPKKNTRAAKRRRRKQRRKKVRDQVRDIEGGSDDSTITEVSASTMEHLLRLMQDATVDVERVESFITSQCLTSKPIVKKWHEVRNQLRKHQEGANWQAVMTHLRSKSVVRHGWTFPLFAACAEEQLQMTACVKEAEGRVGTGLDSMSVAEVEGLRETLTALDIYSGRVQRQRVKVVKALTQRLELIATEVAEAAMCKALEAARKEQERRDMVKLREQARQQAAERRLAARKAAARKVAAREATLKAAALKAARKEAARKAAARKAAARKEAARKEAACKEAARKAAAVRQAAAARQAEEAVALAREVEVVDACSMGSPSDELMSDLCTRMESMNQGVGWFLPSGIL